MTLPAVLGALIPATGGMRLDTGSTSNACGFATNRWHVAKIVASDLTATGATLVVEGSQNSGASWSSALSLSDVDNGGRVLSIAGDGDFGVVCAGYTHVRVRPAVAGTGTAVVGATGVSVDESFVALLGTLNTSDVTTHAPAYYKATVTGAAQTLPNLIGAPIPTWASRTLITVETDASGSAYWIRYRADGTAPTASVGQPITVAAPVLIEGAAALAAAQFISGATTLVNIEFRG